MPRRKQIKYIDLFCGIGSFHYSFQKLGFKCIMASDIYPPAKETYNLNYSKTGKEKEFELLDDICKIDPTKLGKYDILCAGFPCQPFSQAGHHLGFADTRGTMFAEIMRFVKINAPRIVILENVKALINHDNGRTITVIKQNLEAEGYTIIFKVLTCSDYGIPQMRKRVFIVCFKNITVNNIDKFFDLGEYEHKVTLSTFFNKNFAKETAYTIRCGGRASAITNRHNWDGYLVDGEEYRLTIEDGLKLQGFENFELCGSVTKQWKMLGNTIPTNFTDIIGKQLIKHFDFS